MAYDQKTPKYSGLRKFIFSLSNKRGLPGRHSGLFGGPSTAILGSLPGPIVVLELLIPILGIVVGGIKGKEVTF